MNRGAPIADPWDTPTLPPDGLPYFPLYCGGSFVPWRPLLISISIASGALFCIERRIAAPRLRRQTQRGGPLEVSSLLYRRDPCTAVLFFYDCANCRDPLCISKLDISRDDVRSIDWRSCYKPWLHFVDYMRHANRSIVPAFVMFSIVLYVQNGPIGRVFWYFVPILYVVPYFGYCLVSLYRPCLILQLPLRYNELFWLVVFVVHRLCLGRYILYLSMFRSLVLLWIVLLFAHVLWLFWCFHLFLPPPPFKAMRVFHFWPGPFLFY